MILNNYNSLLREHFDFSDRQTTKFIKYINESDQQSQLLTALASALYDKIVDKCDKIDFGSIPRSRGDITKVDGYNNTVECINIIRKLVTEYKEDTGVIDIELTAIENMKSLRPIFIKAFNANSSFAMMYYNIMVASIQHSVSFLIAVAIQFIKDPNSKNIHMALDKAAYRDAESNMILEQIAQMNKAYSKGDLEKLLRESISSIRESVESDEYIENTIDTTEDVSDAIADAPATETIDGDELDEEVYLLKVAGGEDIPQEAPIQQVPSPFTGETPDELSAGANNPDTTQNDEVEPTPVIPINGDCDSSGTKTIDETQKSIVKRNYHKHPTADNGYNDNNNAVNEDFAADVLVGTIADNLKKVEGNGVLVSGKKILKTAIDFLPGNKTVKIIVGSMVGVTVLITVVIPALRDLVAKLWIARANLSESLAIQANLIELNALELEADQSSNLSDEKKSKVIEKQLKVAQKLRSWSDKIAIKDKKDTKEAKKLVEDEKKKSKISDIKNNLPDDIANDSDLF